jgi:hypothetical protein
VVRGREGMLCCDGSPLGVGASAAVTGAGEWGALMEAEERVWEMTAGELAYSNPLSGVKA